VTALYRLIGLDREELQGLDHDEVQEGMLAGLLLRAAQQFLSVGGVVSLTEAAALSSESRAALSTARRALEVEQAVRIGQAAQGDLSALRVYGLLDEGEQHDFLALIGQATSSLDKFSDQLSRSTKVQAKSTEEKRKEDRESRDLQRRASGALTNLAGISHGAAGQIGVGGDAQDAFSTFGLSLMSTINAAPVLGAFAGLTGSQSTQRVLDATRNRVFSVTGDLARYGQEVTDEFRQGQIDIGLQQESRRDAELRRLNAELGSPDNIRRASPVGSDIRESISAAQQYRLPTGDQFLNSSGDALGVALERITKALLGGRSVN